MFYSGTGPRYIGEFKDDLFHGVGEYVHFDDDLVYFGEYKKNVKEGFGEFYCPSKFQAIYTGWLKDGMRDGPGVALWKFYGIWKSDELVKEIKKLTFQSSLLLTKNRVMTTS